MESLYIFPNYPQLMQHFETQTELKRVVNDGLLWIGGMSVIQLLAENFANCELNHEELNAKILENTMTIMRDLELEKDKGGLIQLVEKTLKKSLKSLLKENVNYLRTHNKSIE